MAVKIITHGVDARTKLKSGVDQICDPVKSTLGPKGRNVVIEEEFRDPTVTKDGVAVAKSIEIEDPTENLGAQLIKNASARTNNDVGDGTTTVCVLAQSMFKEGIRNLTAGANPIDLKRGMEFASARIVEALKTIATPVDFSNKEALSNVGTISANGDREIGDLIAEAMQEVGEDGIITIEESQTKETEKETVQGLQFDRGFISGYFITDVDRMECDLKKPYILLIDGRLSDLKPLMTVLEKIKDSNDSVLIIAEDVDGSALQTLVVNKMRAGFHCCAVKAAAFGERRKAVLEDIAAVTGATVISADAGMKLANTTLAHFGTCDNATISKDYTTIAGGKGLKETVDKRISEIKLQIERSQAAYDTQKLQERLARLCAGMAVIRVGADTTPEMMEKKDRYEDTLHATKAAVQEGIVPGGGIALLRAAEVFITGDQEIPLSEDFVTGINIVLRACQEPLRQIVANAGLEGSEVLGNVKRDGKDNPNYGFNASTGIYEDLVVAGVIDPVKVVRTTLENAVSVAGLLLMTEATIIKKREILAIVNPHPED